MRTCLIDADTIIYAAGRAAEEIVDWGDDIVSWYASKHKARLQFSSLIRDIADGMNADRVVLALSDYDTPNWRLGILPTYKEARAASASSRRPLAWRDLRDYCGNFETFMRPTLEGDDVLGILLTHPTLIKGEKIVVSIDKDMKTLPGLHSNFTREANDFGWNVTRQSLAAADYFHLEQTLTGDATDGYKGCPGIGAVTAKKILDPFMLDPQGDDPEPMFDLHGAWAAVVTQYEKKGLTADDALVQARVARICRHKDYNFKTKEVIPWEPPKILPET